MTRFFAVLVIVLGLSACDYTSKTRVSQAPPQGPTPASPVVKDSFGGVATQPPSW